jgi:hypothetical protein
MGPRVRQLLAIFCVAFSLALFALGSTDLVGGFCLRTMSYSRPMSIVGPVLDTTIVSCAIVGVLCEELGRRVNMGLLRPFTAPSKGPPLCHLGCNTMGL